MKSLLTSRIAAFAATLAAGLVAWLASKDIITPDQVAQATGEAVTLLQSLFAAVVAIVVWLAGYIVRNKLAGGNSGGGKTGTGSSGGGFPCVTLFTAAVLSMAGLALPSCSSLSLTGDGCIRTTQVREGKTYAVDTCLGVDGKIDRMRLLWSNEQGQELRATIYRDKRPIVVEYKQAGLWFKWTEGSGISLGATPPEVETAMENAVPLPVEAAK